MRETEILVEQQPPQGVLVCDHAGLVINKLSIERKAGKREAIDNRLRALRAARRSSGEPCILVTALRLTLLSFDS